MRCKRCGAPLEPADTHCPVCGKTLTSRSTPVRKHTDAPVKLPQLEKFLHIYSADNAHSRTMQTLIAVAAVVIIALLVMVYRGVGDLRNAVTDLELTAQAQIQALQNIPEETEQPTQAPTEVQTQTEPAEPAAPVSVPLSRREITARIRLRQTASGTYVAAAMDLRQDDDTADAWVTAGGTAAGRKTEVSWILEDTGDRLDVTLSDTYGTEDAQVYAQLSWAPAGSTFGSYTNPVCIWEYRVSGGEWTEVDPACVTAGAGNAVLTLTADQFAGMLDLYTQLELRCRFSLAHPDGGTMELLVEGIEISGEGLAAGTMPG